MIDWTCISMHDPDGRRGVWYRVSDGYLEVRGGREGDDAWAKIPVAGIPDDELAELVSAFDYGHWMQSDYGPNSELQLSRDQRPPKPPNSGP